MSDLFIGRDERCQIVITDSSVSRRHAKIQLSQVGAATTYLIEDTDSKHGTFLRENAGWRRIQSETVTLMQEVRFGLHVITVADLLKLASPERAARADTAIRAERNPQTGEIIKRQG